LGLEKWLGNEEAGLKNNTQLQVKLDKAIYALSQGWGNLTLTECEKIAKKIIEIKDVFNLDISKLEINSKKFKIFCDKFLSADKNIFYDNFFSFDNYVSLNYLLELKFSDYFYNDIFMQSTINDMDYIDNLLILKNLKQNKKFESFVVSIADRNRVGIKEKSAKIIIESIATSVKIPFEKVLFAIGINDVGEVGAKNLASNFKNIDNLILASYDELIAIRDVGESTAKNIITFFANNHNVQIINKLKDAGLSFCIEVKELNSNKLENLSFVISGTFTIDRSELKKYIEDNGGKVVSALSKSTSYLIVGENMGAVKKEKAEKENIKMISEVEFFNL
jgi:DNA ligase (NAD+)